MLVALTLLFEYIMACGGQGVDRITEASVDISEKLGRSISSDGIGFSEGCRR
jgi:hypothetical protein